MSGGNHNGLASFFDFTLQRACAHICPVGLSVENEDEALQLLEEIAQEVGDKVGNVRMAYRQAFQDFLSPDPDSASALFQPTLSVA